MTKATAFACDTHALLIDVIHFYGPARGETFGSLGLRARLASPYLPSMAKLIGLGMVVLTIVEAVSEVGSLENGMSAHSRHTYAPAPMLDEPEGVPAERRRHDEAGYTRKTRAGSAQPSLCGKWNGSSAVEIACVLGA
ncbi:MAG: hypothetical protein E5V85_10770 [Mesorhizobium sp.]|nr:MAG: hypothetical protein E5V85_10770 [Mesorhizobium sp.]